MLKVIKAILIMKYKTIKRQILFYRVTIKFFRILNNNQMKLKKAKISKVNCLKRMINNKIPLSSNQRALKRAILEIFSYVILLLNL
jgi:GTP cyclohydrolase II